MSIRNFIKISEGDTGAASAGYPARAAGASDPGERGICVFFLAGCSDTERNWRSQDIASYFRLWDDRESLQARNIVHSADRIQIMILSGMRPILFSSGIYSVR